MGEFQIAVDIPELMDDEGPATARQKQFIRALARETGITGLSEEMMEQIGVWQASSLIDQLKDAKKQLEGDRPIDTDRITVPEDQRRGLPRIAKLFLIAVAVVAFLLALMSFSMQ